MKSFKKKKKGDVKETLIQYSDARAGCDLHGEEWDETAKKCTGRVITDPDFPDEVTSKKFDDVKKDRGGVKTSQTETE